MKLEMKIFNMWVPKPQRVGDRNIMETAIDDSYFHRKYGWKLEVINNCRMYLGIFYISEIMNEGGHVKRSFLEGDEQVKTYLQHFQGRRKPPKQAWLEWKAYVFRNFLINGYEVYPPLGESHEQVSTSVRNEMDTLASIAKGTLIKRILD